MRRGKEARGVPWTARVDDARMGSLRLTGRIGTAARGDRLVVIVHGLGGSTESHYIAPATMAAEALGLDWLAINLRGADRLGEDFYHAGLTDDLHAALRSTALERYAWIGLVGYSLGGHVALRYALEPSDPRVRAVAAVCPPVDLDRGVEAIDRPERALYRQHVLAALQDIYAAVASRRPVPLPIEDARRIRSIRTWDELTIAPRFGFQSAKDYYAKVSVGPRLSDVAVPSLIVSARHDPMVPEETLSPSIERRSRLVEHVSISNGGHVGFPSSLDLGVRARRGLEHQVLAWLVSRA
jgi:predicted alpha/beta-fold hydrolase